VRNLGPTATGSRIHGYARVGGLDGGADRLLCRQVRACRDSPKPRGQRHEFAHYAGDDHRGAAPSAEQQEVRDDKIRQAVDKRRAFAHAHGERKEISGGMSKV